MKNKKRINQALKDAHEDGHTPHSVSLDAEETLRKSGLSQQQIWDVRCKGGYWDEDDRWVSAE